MNNLVRTLLTVAFSLFLSPLVQGQEDGQKPVRSEVIKPIRNETFDKNGNCKERKQGGNPRRVNGFLLFDGSQDGNRQVDPQIAIGGGHILHGTNSGLIIYKKDGTFVSGVSRRCFNGGIDPKLFFDKHNGIFGFDLWNPWDKAKLKPVNVSVPETSNPTGARWVSGNRPRHVCQSEVCNSKSRRSSRRTSCNRFDR